MMLCGHCKRNEATCIGQYDNMPDTVPACDSCCGHGNEDGFCDPIETVLEPVPRASESQGGDRG